MDPHKILSTRTELLEVLITISSVLGIAGYFLYNPVFFTIAGSACTALVVMLCVFSWVTTPAPVRAIYGIYGVIFALLELIGCLVTRELGSGLLLGTCFVGVSIVLLSKLITWIHGGIESNAPEWLDPDYDPYDEEEGEKSHIMKPILLDENAAPEDRIKDMSTAFCRMDAAFAALDRSKDIILNNIETLKALKSYVDSGLWQKDFEAAERGEIGTDCDLFGVLSEDGLYNFLQDAKEILQEVSLLNQND